MKRLAYALLFLAAAAGAIYMAGLAVWQLWFFALAPDLTSSSPAAPTCRRVRSVPAPSLSTTLLTA